MELYRRQNKKDRINLMEIESENVYQCKIWKQILYLVVCVFVCGFIVNILYHQQKKKKTKKQANMG